MENRFWVPVMTQSQKIAINKAADKTSERLQSALSPRWVPSTTHAASRWPIRAHRSKSEWMSKGPMVQEPSFMTRWHLTQISPALRALRGIQFPKQACCPTQEPKLLQTMTIFRRNQMIAEEHRRPSRTSTL